MMTDLSSVNSKIKRIWSDWQAVSSLGVGTYGEVYSAQLGGADGCEAAIKVITLPRNEADALNIADPQSRERAAAEYSSIAGALDAELSRMSVLKNAPNIVSTEAYSVSPSENGIGFDVLIRTEKLMPIASAYSEKEALKLGIDICMALEEAEKAGIVHGNIKPSNLFATEVGTYKLGDFGLASVLGCAVSDKTVYIGAPKYAAPELAQSCAPDIRSDIYSLGTVLRELLPESVCPPFGDVLNKACSDDPKARYATAPEFKQALVNVYTSIMFGGAVRPAADPIITEVFDISEKLDEADAYQKQLETSAEVQSRIEDDFDVSEYSAAFEGDEESETVFEPVKPKKQNKKSKAPIILLLIVLALLLLGIIAFGVSALISFIGSLPDSGNADETSVSSEVISLTIDVLPEKLEYRLEEPIDLEGLVLTAHLSDGTSVPVTEGYTVSPKIAEYAGINEITLMYGDQFVTFNIDANGASLNMLTVVTPPEKTVYSIGEEYDFAGLVLEAVYSDGEVLEITEGFTVEPASADELGERTVKVSYGSKSVDVLVEVTESTVKALVIKSLPSRLNYFIGEKLDPAGMRLNVTRTNGIMATVSTGFTVSPSRFTKSGTQTVTITYGDKSVSFDVEVGGALLNNIEIASMPHKTSYYVGEALVTDGLTINEVYTDGTVKRITSGFTVSPTVLSGSGEQKITVSYNGKTASFKVSVNGVVMTSLSVLTNPAKLDYVEGETLDLTGLTLAANYSNGISESVHAESVNASPTVLTTPGFVPITVSYGGHSTTLYVNVAEPVAVTGSLPGGVSWEIKRGMLTVSGKGEIGHFGYLDTPWAEYSGSVTNVTVESGITSVGDYAFAGLSARKIILPDTLKSISDTVFYGCTSLTEISVSSANRNFKSSGGILYSKDMTKLLAYPAGKADASFEVPSTVKTVGGYEIFGGTALREITIGESVYSVSPTAFVGAKKLEKINVRARCAVLTAVDGVLYSKNMNELVCYPAGKAGSTYAVPDTVKYIRENAFRGCALQSLSVPSSVKQIGDNAFLGCNSLTSVSYLSTPEDYAAISVGAGNTKFTDCVNIG